MRLSLTTLAHRAEGQNSAGLQLSSEDWHLSFCVLRTYAACPRNIAAPQENNLSDWRQAEAAGQHVGLHYAPSFSCRTSCGSPYSTSGWLRPPAIRGSPEGPISNLGSLACTCDCLTRAAISARLASRSESMSRLTCCLPEGRTCRASWAKL